MSEVRAIDTPTLIVLVKVAPTTLNYWVGRGFITPTLDGGGGRRATRYWTVHDVLVVRAVKVLRDAGCSLQNIASVEATLRRAFQRNLANSVLVYDGRDVLLREGEAAVSLLRERGQAVFTETLTLVCCPLGRWHSEVDAQAQLIDMAAIKERREIRRGKRGAA